MKRKKFIFGVLLKFEVIGLVFMAYLGDFPALAVENIPSDTVFSDILRAFTEMNTEHLKNDLSLEGKIFFSLPALEIQGNYFSSSHFIGLLQNKVFREVKTIRFEILEKSGEPQTLWPGPLLRKAVWEYQIKRNNKKYRDEILIRTDAEGSRRILTRIHSVHSRAL
jgi:hypothetical protein